MYEFLGYCGAIILTVAVIPQMLKTIKDNNANGLSLTHLILLLLGFIFILLYILTTTKQTPLIIGYSLNCCFVSVLLYYKIFK